jgi:two-component system response regulator DesR
MATVLLVDNEPLIRRGLRMRLEREPGLEVVGEACDGAAALALARSLRPDIMLMELNLPGPDGIAVTAMLRAVLPRCTVILLSLDDDDGTRARALAMGAAAFIGKGEGVPVLLETLRRIAGAVPP